MFEILASLLLAQLAGSRTLHLTADNEAIWPSKEEDGVERTAWREWRGENGVERTAWRGQRGEDSVERPALVVTICQSVDLKRATGCLKSI